MILGAKDIINSVTFVIIWYNVLIAIPNRSAMSRYDPVSCPTNHKYDKMCFLAVTFSCSTRAEKYAIRCLFIKKLKYNFFKTVHFFN